MSQELSLEDEVKSLRDSIEDVVEGHSLDAIANATAHVLCAAIVQHSGSLEGAESTAGTVTKLITSAVRGYWENKRSIYN
jgi:hypothetical protein